MTLRPCIHTAAAAALRIIIRRLGLGRVRNDKTTLAHRHPQALHVVTAPASNSGLDRLGIVVVVR